MHRYVIHLCQLSLHLLDKILCCTYLFVWLMVVRTFLGWVSDNGKHEGKADDAGNTQTRQGVTSKKTADVKTPLL